MSRPTHSGSGRLKRLRALKHLRVKRRHLKRALLATTPTAVLFSSGSMPVVRIAVPFAIAATVPVTSEVQGAITAAVQPTPEPPLQVIAEAVEASYYGDEFAGRPTASGEPFDPTLLTAAHRTLPLGSLVQVTVSLSGRSVTVRINDRGPFHGDRAIDLSSEAASRIGLVEAGTGQVSLHLISGA